MTDPRRVEGALRQAGRKPFRVKRTYEWLGGWIDGICGILEDPEQVESCVIRQLTENLDDTFRRGTAWQEGVLRFAGLASPEDPVVLDTMKCAMLSEILPEMLPDAEVAQDRPTTFHGCMGYMAATAKSRPRLVVPEILTR